jgi:hypothetical protein
LQYRVTLTIFAKKLLLLGRQLAIASTLATAATTQKHCEEE